MATITKDSTKYEPELVADYLTDHMNMAGVEDFNYPTRIQLLRLRSRKSKIGFDALCELLSGDGLGVEEFQQWALANHGWTGRYLGRRVVTERGQPYRWERVLS